MNNSKLRYQQRTVQRVVQSPMNAIRWCLELSCGHEKWVTSKSRPKRIKAQCEKCVPVVCD